ncbi:hypothetical protein [Cryobacterium sp. 10C3]|uniref:hypothetical protein n=1 Tax=Cryobacterium sp. 10C3 TaxID=3048577 RepID=UPI002AB5BC6D|nr:hypothetical protein [Cryobacterium sp. 10C3]MDY7555813.1 hypothetical protein [Cryobacterium sp. 10C3]
MRGVTYNQVNIKAIGKGKHKFALVAEPTNKADRDAVMVCAIVKQGLAKVGYLPAGEYKTEHFQALAARLESEKVLLVSNGKVEKIEGGLGVQLQLPKWQWLKERLAQ